MLSGMECYVEKKTSISTSAMTFKGCGVKKQEDKNKKQEEYEITRAQSNGGSGTSIKWYLTVFNGTFQKLFRIKIQHGQATVEFCLEPSIRF